MGAVTPETCRVTLQKINICILLHLVGILLTANKVFFFVKHLSLDGQKGPGDVRGLPYVCKSLYVIIVQLLSLYMLTCLTAQNMDNCKFGYKCVH